MSGVGPSGRKGDAGGVVGCPSCGAANPRGKNFCGDCGARLSTTTPERRTLAVLFCDLLDSTGLAVDLDPEDVRSVMSAYRSACERGVVQFDGHVAQWLGDGALVYFGYPTTHEDDALRSVLSGLAIVEEVNALDVPLLRKRGFDMRVRVGIHMGPVVVGEIGRRREELAEGEAPNIAARIQSSADPNTVVVSETILELVRGSVDVEELAVQSVKGLPRPLRLHRILRATGSASRMQVAAKAGFTPYVGRDQNVASLLDRWEDARRGEGQVVFVSGLAGLGKSRLVEVIKERLAAEAEILHCQCSPLHRNTALYPVVSLLQRRLEFRDDDSSLTRLESLERAMGNDAALPHAVALLAPLLSIPSSPNHSLAGMTLPRQRRLMLETLQRWLFRRPRDKSAALVVLEDLQWADPSTLELMGLMLEAIQSQQAAHVLVVPTFRSDELSRRWPLGPRVHDCALVPLGPEQAAAMAHGVVRSKALPTQVVRDIIERSGGVPLFIEELTKFYLQTGALVDRGDRYELTSALPSAVPGTLKGLLIARLDRLETRHREIAQIAASIGRSFGYELMSAVSGVSDAMLGEALDRLVRAELIYQDGSPPDASYVFKHALIREAAYETLLKVRRQEFHERIARTLEERFPALRESQPELLAGHYTGAGARFNERAVAYWSKAGMQALARSDNVEAISHLSKAAELAEHLPSGLNRDLAELEAHSALAPAQMAIRGWQSVEVEATCGRANEVCQKLLAQPLDDKTKANVRVRLAGSLWGLWTVQFLRGNLIPALGFAHQVLGMAHAVGDPMLEVLGHHAVGFTDYFAGRFAEAERHARAGIDKFQPEIERTIVLAYQFSSTVALRSFAASSLWNQGRPDEALAMLETAYSLVKSELNGHPPSVAYLEAFASFHFLFRRDLDRLAKSSSELRRLSYQEGFLLWLPFTDAFDGIVQAHRPGELDAGLALLRRGMDRLRGAGCLLDVPELEAWEARILLGASRAEEALAVAGAAIASAAVRDAGLSASELARLRGEAMVALAARSGQRTDDAERQLRRAVDIARAQGAKLLELRAVTSLWRARSADPDASRRSEVLDRLRQVCRSFTEGFGTLDLREANALLDAADAG